MFWTNLAIYILLTCYVLDCLFMGLIILMQRSKQEGLGAAFGGGITESVFGAQTSQVLVKATVYAAIIFFGLSITLARLYSHLDVIALKNQSPVQQLLSQPVPKAAAATPTTPVPVTPAAAPAPTPVAPTPAATTTTVPSPITPATAKPSSTPPSAK